MPHLVIPAQRGTPVRGENGTLKTKNNSRTNFPAPRTIVSRIFLFFYAGISQPPASRQNPGSKQIGQPEHGQLNIFLRQ